MQDSDETKELEISFRAVKGKYKKLGERVSAHASEISS